MSTSCVIAYRIFGNTFVATRCNFDGGLNGVGAELRQFFTEGGKIQELIHGGDIRAINAGVAEYYPRNEIVEPVTVDEKGLSELRIKWGCDFVHYFANGEWLTF